MRPFFRHKPEEPLRRQSSFSRTPAQPREPRTDIAFRRGRTLTGSSSPQIFSTNETGADLKSPRVHAHLLAKKRRHLSGLFFLTVAGATLFFLLVSQFTAKAVVQATPDPSIQLDERYSVAISSYLSDHPAERWRFFLNRDRLEEYLHAVAPEVKTIDTKGSAGVGASLFVINFRTPIASWNVNGEQLYVDVNGVPFKQNYFSSPTLAVTDRSGVPLSPGESVASNRFMGFVGQVIGRVKTYGYSVSGITIPAGMTRQIEVRLNGVGYPIKFSSDRPAGEEVEDMIRAVGWMKERQLEPEYLDVRVKGKVFYR